MVTSTSGPCDTDRYTVLPVIDPNGAAITGTESQQTV